MADDKSSDWVRYNGLTHTYDTKDGTSVAAEIVDGAECLADVLRISQIRAKQRAQSNRPTVGKGE